MEAEKQVHQPQEEHHTNWHNILKFIGYSFIGAFMFFIPITINGSSSIMLDHMVTFIRENFTAAVPYYILAVIVFGAIYPFANKTWNKNKVVIGLSMFKIAGAIFAFMLVFDFGPAWLFNPGLGPFLFNNLVTSVGVLVPIGAVFLALLVGYGFLEFIGVLVQPIMRPVWKTPGRSAINAVASFVGSYSIGMLITNRVYKEGKYTLKEAWIIATGFSTVSATFMVVVASTLDIMHIWNTYFWVTLFVTFLVTAITVRIWPLNIVSEDYYQGQEGTPEVQPKGNRLKAAWDEGMSVANDSLPLLKNVWINFKDGVIMAASILPTILSVGLLGLILSTYTPVFDIIGYIFYPFTLLVQLPEPLLAAKAAAVEIAEMFLPALMVVDASLVTKFVMGVLSVSAIIFFSATIPTILATDIEVSIPKLIIIWIERTILTILIATPIAFLLL